jgi:hypothetical protein
MMMMTKDEMMYPERDIVERKFNFLPQRSLLLLLLLATLLLWKTEE